MSHPLRVRGLKPLTRHNSLAELVVASFTGAWIETWKTVRVPARTVSHPLRVRGLKHYIADNRL